ncbi:unnamed protein product [Musa acuminata var. zebrina]
MHLRGSSPCARLPPSGGVNAARPVLYCSQKCQILHWRSGHRKVCRAKKFDHPAHQKKAHF